MKTTIHIGSQRIYAYHGVLPQERVTGNYFRVETSLHLHCAKALLSDQIEDTVNYAEVCRVIADEMSVPSQLLEHVAGRIIVALQQKFPQIDGGSVTVTKEKPPIPGEVDEVSVTVEW